MHGVVVGCVFDTSENSYVSIFRVEVKAEGGHTGGNSLSLDPTER